MVKFVRSTGERIRGLREERDWTQKELAARVMVERATVASWETDRRLPEPAALSKLADIFEVTVDYLLCRTEGTHNAHIATDASAPNERANARLHNGLLHSGDQVAPYSSDGEPRLVANTDMDKELGILERSTEVHDSLASRISTLREARRMGVADLAGALGVSEQLVEHWELGLALPEPAHLRSIAELFNVTVDWLLGRVAAPDQTKPLDLPPGWQEILMEAVGRGLDPADVKRAIEFLSDVQAKQKREG